MSAPLAPLPAVPAPLKRGDRVLVRARNVLFWANAYRKEPLDAVPAVVVVAPKGPGHYLLRSDYLSGGFAAPVEMIELVEALEAP